MRGNVGCDLSYTLLQGQGFYWLCQFRNTILTFISSIKFIVILVCNNKRLIGLPVPNIIILQVI